jgi:hypothetical protein
MENTVRKTSKTLLYPPGDDRIDARPRGVSGATITSWDGPPEVDLEPLFSKPDDHASLGGAVSQAAGSVSRVAADTSKYELFTLTTPERLVTVAII